MVPPMTQFGDAWIEGDRLTPWEINTRFGIPREEIAAFQAAIRIYPYGAAIITEGDDDQTLFLVRFGRVSIQKRIEGERWDKIGEVEATNFVGEMTLFNAAPRSASVLADSDEVLVYAITRPRLSMIFSNPKWAELLISRLCKDLSAGNAQIVNLTRANRDQEEALAALAGQLQEEKEARAQDKVKFTRVLAMLLHFQKAIFDLSVYGSKSWTYLNAYPELTRQATDHFFPGLIIPEDFADERLMLRLLKQQQTLLPGTLMEDLKRKVE